MLVGCGCGELLPRLCFPGCRICGLGLRPVALALASDLLFLLAQHDGLLGSVERRALAAWMAIPIGSRSPRGRRPRHTPDSWPTGLRTKCVAARAFAALIVAVGWGRVGERSRGRIARRSCGPGFVDGDVRCFVRRGPCALWQIADAMTFPAAALFGISSWLSFVRATLVAQCPARGPAPPVIPARWARSDSFSEIPWYAFLLAALPPFTVRPSRDPAPFATNRVREVGHLLDSVPRSDRCGGDPGHSGGGHFPRKIGKRRLTDLRQTSP